MKRIYFFIAFLTIAQNTFAQSNSLRFNLGISTNTSYTNNMLPISDDYLGNVYCYYCFHDNSEQNSFSYSYGLQVGIEFNRYIRINTGIEYQNMVINRSSQYDYGIDYYLIQEIYYSDVTEIKNISIPLSIAVKLSQKKNFSTFFESGIKLKFNQQQEEYYNYYAADLKKRTTTGFIKMNLVWSFKQIELGLAPTFAFSLTPINEINFYNYNQQPYHIGMSTSANYFF